MEARSFEDLKHQREMDWKRLDLDRRSMALDMAIQSGENISISTQEIIERANLFYDFLS